MTTSQIVDLVIHCLSSEKGAFMLVITETFFVSSDYHLFWDVVAS